MFIHLTFINMFYQLIHSTYHRWGSIMKIPCYCPSRIRNVTFSRVYSTVAIGKVPLLSTFEMIAVHSITLMYPPVNMWVGAQWATDLLMTSHTRNGERGGRRPCHSLAVVPTPALLSLKSFIVLILRFSFQSWLVFAIVRRLLPIWGTSFERSATSC